MNIFFLTSLLFAYIGCTNSTTERAQSFKTNEESSTERYERENRRNSSYDDYLIKFLFITGFFTLMLVVLPIQGIYKIIRGMFKSNRN
jgi:hypothetical protein